MFFPSLVLSQLLDQCAPQVGRRTMAAIVQVESGGNPLLIRDNTLDRTFAPQDARQGVVWAGQLLRLHHSVDLGISQINDANLPKLGLSVRDAFDPCSNVRAGATILASDYRAAAAQFGPGQLALRRALGAYNTGSLYAGYGYVAKILAAAGIDGGDDFRVPELQAVASPSPGAGGGAAGRSSLRAPQRNSPDPNTAPILVTAHGMPAQPSLVWAHAGISLDSGVAPAASASPTSSASTAPPARSAPAVAPGPPVPQLSPTATPWAPAYSRDFQN